jgi:hypothetical protein
LWAMPGSGQNELYVRNALGGWETLEMVNRRRSWRKAV